MSSSLFCSCQLGISQAKYIAQPRSASAEACEFYDTGDEAYLDSTTSYVFAIVKSTLVACVRLRFSLVLSDWKCLKLQRPSSLPDYGTITC